LTVIAASLAAYAAAQKGDWGDKSSFRGSKDSASKWGKKDSSSSKWGKKDTGAWKKPSGGSKWGKKPSGSGKGSDPTKGSWHDFFNRYKSHACTTKYVPKDLLARYKSEFEALDTNHDGSISPAEFAGTGAKIASSFAGLRKGHSKGGHGSGQHHYGHGMEGSGSSSHHFGGRGSGASHGGFGHGNRQLADKKYGSYDKSRYAGKYDKSGKSGYDKSGKSGKSSSSGKSSWWKYLQSHGFVRKTTPMTAASKDAKEAKMAASVFSKFDKNHSKTISVCEFENAMYRTESLEKRLGMKTDGNIVVVHG